MQPLGRSTYHRKALIFKTGQATSYVAGDDGAYEVGENHNYEALTAGQYSGTTSIVLNGKTEVKSNECVIDHACGLMWARTPSASVGPTSNGLLPWTTNGNGEGVFTYAAATNAAALAGYTDWRIPNVLELLTLIDYEAPSGYPLPSIFPYLTDNNNYWTSTTGPNATTGAMYILWLGGLISRLDKASTGKVLLVRGPLS